MLEPTVQQRHSKNPFLSNMENLRKTFAKGFLLGVYLDTEWVGANLVYDDKHGTLLATNIGWRGSNKELMKKRIVSAIFYELIKRASDQGFHALDVGNSNPFANDGPLNYKLKWGASIELPKIEYTEKHIQGVRSFVAVRINLASQSAKLILNNTPLFEKHKSALRVIGWNSTMPPVFKKQINEGLSWVNLAKTHPTELST